jgi:hypothetical protein
MLSFIRCSRGVTYWRRLMNYECTVPETGDGDLQIKDG